MIYAVICEFNPFHNGHRYLLSRLPKGEGDCTVCVMSGSFTQRGEPAGYDKWSRASAAVRHGADLVLELPIPFALADSDRFAAAGAALAAALGLPATLAFGTESGDLAALERLAALPAAQTDALTKEGLEQGLSYGAARQRALELQLPAESRLLQSPNDLLAYGYIKAGLPLGLRFLGVRRTAPHNGAPVGDTASASYIRRHPAEFDRYCPARQGPELDRAKAESGLLTLLKTKTTSELAQCAHISEGLENRIAAALTTAADWKTLADAVKTKRYSHARLRRALVCGALGLPAALPLQPPPYLRVLAMNARGGALLKAARKTASLPILQTGVACEQASAAFFRAERIATDLWNGWCRTPAPAGADYLRGALYLE